MSTKDGEPHRKNSGGSSDVATSDVSYMSGAPIRLWQGDSLSTYVSVDSCLGCHDVSDAVCDRCSKKKHRKIGFQHD
ncbi:MAG: hypothetical protein UV00_C0010G0005 [candidate division WWE3 bacterium GW2011_GWF1_42_14]|uniref:Uncharacterized protein n=1 Tax=candidate division WWE3 bacterium GW2011_GWF1_42_14 TaxID=1619138 RepID=A0A0G1BKC8_UNCKA|nr:MAG: hypothetical protein UU92_C0011G0004 [candidate division WWE3 bacterium GW2011_GWA1_42_12]KKS34456.1 MAG: hypothetical protein UU97_C0010G0003 [candidate division WWE3 bacterium GW2011_GWD1_42_14]KKS37933.1 MAG: hypothetical protein UV00_C0010G0005 [candidate division WWE3 bacterium GW2011_GWF1_42_14]KKS40240.1 MAG: hypothetical protein UV03_C0009G0003 [candidate division WWE3 bacterium GW2011_GWE1_42_16]